MAKITFVLPTKNEEHSIAKVIAGLKNECAVIGHSICKILVVDDSTDQTRSVAEKSGATVISGGGQGLGSAMLKGLKSAAETNSDVIVSLDTDGQVVIDELKLFVEPVLKNEADLVIGSRFLGDASLAYEYPKINRFGVIVLTAFLRLTTGLPITDSHGGFRALAPEVAEKIEIWGQHTYVQEAIIDSHRKGFRVLEIPSEWKARKHGHSRVVHSIPKYIVRTLPYLLKRVIR